MVEYRSFIKEDADEVYAIALEAWRHTYKGIFDDEFIEKFVNENYAPKGLVSLVPNIESGKMFFDVAVDKSHIIGFSNIGDRGQGWELFRIYLLPAYIGKGVGKRLLRLGEAFLRSKDANKYFCFVHKDNRLGINFYLRNGFRHLPEKDKEDEWCMEKIL